MTTQPAERGNVNPHHEIYAPVPHPDMVFDRGVTAQAERRMIAAERAENRCPPGWQSLGHQYADYLLCPHPFKAW